MRKLKSQDNTRDLKMEDFSSSYNDDDQSSLHSLDDELARQQVLPKYVQPGQNPLQNVFLGKKLGRGAFGDVYVGQIEGFPDHRVVAVKCISKRAVSKRDLSTQLAMEIAVHQHLKHPNIIQFYDFTQDQRKVYFFLGKGAVPAPLNPPALGTRN
jgi:hypothetical protein